MTIPVSQVVNVTISLTPTAPSRAGFGVLLAVTTQSGVVSTSEVRSYANMDEVSVDWSPSDEFYKMANTWFSQSPKPAEIRVGFWDTVGEPAVATALDRLNNLSPDFYAFAFDSAVRDSLIANAITDAATWAEARVKQFFTVSNDVNVLDNASTTDIAYVLNAAARTRTFVMYSSTAAEYPEVSAFARAATVQFDQPDSVITLKFKQLPGITAESLTSANLTTLNTKGCNAYATVGSVDMLLEGIMAKGLGTYQDTIHGVDWLQNAIETNVFGYLFTRTTKVPYTDKGAAALEQQVINGLKDGVRNGLIADGGTDFEGNFLPQGFETSVVKVADVSQANRQNRIGPPITFKAIGAGAIHNITITGTFEV